MSYRREDGNFAVDQRTVRGRGKVYLLNEEEFRGFEDWFIRQVEPNLSPKRLIIAPFIVLVLFGAYLAVLLELISLGLAIVFALAVLIPSFWFASRVSLRGPFQWKEPFPYPDAPTTKIEFQTSRKRIFLIVASSRIVTWGTWFVLIIKGIPVALVTLLLAVIVSFNPANSFSPQDLSEAWEMLQLAVIFALVFVGLPLLILIPRHRFKKRTGASLTLKSLYFDELGHDLDGLGHEVST